MTYQDTNVSKVENVGSLDRVNRGIAGMTLIMAATLITTIPSAAAAGMVALGVYAGLTAVIGWDPLYALVKAFQQQTPAQPSAAVTRYPHSRMEDQPSSGSHKKAA